MQGWTEGGKKGVPIYFLSTYLVPSLRREKSYIQSLLKHCLFVKGCSLYPLLGPMTCYDVFTRKVTFQYIPGR
jgi:hypothetical protein